VFAVKEKYGSDADTDDLDADDSDSESDESEDEDGEELTPALDAAILRTLARIKARDPGIYDADRNVFEGTTLISPHPSLVLMTPYRRTEEHGKSGALSAPSRTKKAKAHKPVTLPEQRLAAALDVATSRSVSPEASSSFPPTHVAEQAALRAETIAAFHADTGGVAEEEVVDEGGLFTLREKTRDEVELEEAEYRVYLEREVGPLEEILDLGEEAKVEDEIHRQGDEGSPARSGESLAGKAKKKKKKGKVVEQRQETDQEFLIKCGVLLFLSHVQKPLTMISNSWCL
jgi:protein KRI1